MTKRAPMLLICSPSSRFEKEKHFLMMLVRYEERDKAFMFFSILSLFKKPHIPIYVLFSPTNPTLH
jgi:hypothetical protein